MPKTEIIEREGAEEDTRIIEPISQNTPVRLGIVIGIVGGIIGALVMVASAVYWAGATSQKLDQVVTIVTSVAGKTDGNTRDLSDHKSLDESRWNGMNTRLSILEQTGSEATRKLVERVAELEARLRIDEATWKKP